MIELKKPMIFYTLPVLIIGTYDKEGNPDAFNVAWGGQTDSNQLEINISAHQSTDNILENKEFTVSFATKDTVVLSDYFGVVSARKDKEKFKKSGAHQHKSEHINAPVIEEYPLTLECVVDEVVDYGDSEYKIIANVEHILADESILTDGKIDTDKLKPISYDPSDHTYRVIGEVVGKAFGDGLNYYKEMQ